VVGAPVDIPPIVAPAAPICCCAAVTNG